ncbi:MAG: N-glycosylase/DNA lyase [Elusimicrobiota bacterium]|jgi:N-glycosylase/DNA lyase|nr:N-glycosylase/DNA lyase [Elusimicrobiota bacterium]
MNPVIKIDFIQTPTNDSKTISGLKKYWESIEHLLIKREKHFDDVWKKANDEEIFAELVFCLFTPQSKAVLCWAAVNELAKKDMIFNAAAQDISSIISKVRFRRNKAGFVIKARELFSDKGKIKIKNKLKSFDDIYQLRNWLIKNVKGIGYKEAGHFLRNIGLGKDLAILDRHILKNLLFFGAIKEIPKNLTHREYERIEKEMRNFSKKTGIPMAHLDMILWCKESGGIFK